VVIGLFGFVENSGASFEQVGLEECKDRKAPRPREVDGLNVALVAAFPAVDLRTERDMVGGIVVAEVDNAIGNKSKHPIGQR